jgi:hypothetical protein
MFNEEARQLRTKMQPAIKSKLEEFQLMGYGHIQENQIWEYLENKKWKKEGQGKMLHQVINDILTLKAGDIINFMTMQSYKTTSFEKEDFIEEWKDVLK